MPWYRILLKSPMRTTQRDILEEAQIYQIALHC